MSVIVQLMRHSRLEFSSFLKSPTWEDTSQRFFRQKAKPKEIRVTKEELKSGPKLDVHEVELAPAEWRSLVRPAIFTVAFTGCTLSCCAIWQYENMRMAALKSRIAHWRHSVLGRPRDQIKAGARREEIRLWWERLNDGEKLFWPIAGLNFLVWCAWRVPRAQTVMFNYFTGNPAAKATCLPLILSVFSHYSFIHLAANMFVLHSFMGPSVHMLGKEQFLGVYLSAGVISSFASMVLKVATKKTSFSLGASGAICTVLGMFATLVPTAKLNVIFLPMFTFSAASALKGLIVMDSAGIILGWRFFDHAAHLSGLLLGVGWCYYGNALLWEKREGLVTMWHNIRDNNRRD